ncbi:cytochrome P450 3A19-like [Ixodes scapularis]|uniref:cytochrome P450 3A19-like n=1 Tax=Ixodes scapularis TaxID=6945 RepID=UPI001C37F7FE|nr:cytochrome P450 3A19-like [Ixodes scapularis]
MESYVETILRIEYLDQVTLEALRLYPPVAGFITRTCEKDYHYKSLKIPSGMTILIPVHQLHRDLNLWNQPEAFDPDRFSACNKSILNSVQYQAFGNGPRRCMGMRFAQLELKIAFAKILANYSLFLDERHFGANQLKLKTSFIFANPRDGVWIKLKKVSRQSCDNKAS